MHGQCVHSLRLCDHRTSCPCETWGFPKDSKAAGGTAWDMLLGATGWMVILEHVCVLRGFLPLFCTEHSRHGERRALAPDTVAA